jgi:hypothetical protein
MLLYLRASPSILVVREFLVAFNIYGYHICHKYVAEKSGMFYISCDSDSCFGNISLTNS